MVRTNPRRLPGVPAAAAAGSSSVTGAPFADLVAPTLGGVEEGEPISYQALEPGVPVVTASGNEFGTVHHVLQVERLDLFDGISVKTKHGLRFVDRDQVDEIRTTVVRTSLTDDQAAALPAPEGPPSV